MQKSNEELAAMVASGDDNAAAQLWEQVHDFIAWRARSYVGARESVNGATVDDLTQQGYLAMVAAAKRYDPDRGRTFVSYMNDHLRTAFAIATGTRTSRIDPLNASDDRPAARSLDTPIDADDAESSTLYDLIPDANAVTTGIVDDQLQYDQLQQTCKSVLDKLPPEEAEAIRQRFYEQRTYQDIANESGEPYHVCRDRVNRGIRRIRQTPRLCNPLQAIMLERQVDELTNFYSTGTSAWFTRQERGVELIAERREYIRRHRAECLAQLDADREYRRQKLQKQFDETRNRLQSYSDSAVSQSTISK